MAVYRRYKFINQDYESIAPIFYTFGRNDNGNILEIESGCSLTHYLTRPTDLFLMSAERLGYHKRILTPATPTETYTVAIDANSANTLETTLILLSGDGEIASNDRLISAFTTNVDEILDSQIRAISGITHMDTNYGYAQRPQVIRDIDFKYSNQALIPQTSLVLRLQDYLRTTNIWDNFSAAPFVNKWYYAVMDIDKSASTESLISYALSATTGDSVTFLPQSQELGITTAYTMHHYSGSSWEQPSWYPTSAGTNGSGAVIMSGEGFSLYLAPNSTQPSDNVIRHTIIENQVISGIVGTFNSIRTNYIGFIAPSVSIETSTSAFGSYHTTTYVSGETIVELLKSGATSIITATTRTYPISISNRWVTVQNTIMSQQWYKYENNNIVPTQIISVAETERPTTVNFLLKITCNVRRVIVLHTGCFNWTYDNHWLKLITKTRLLVPRQVIMYGYN